MKILFFAPYYFPYTSGVTMHAYRLFKNFPKGHAINILTFKHKGDLHTFETIDDTKVFRIPYLFKVSKGFISPQSFYYFYKYLKTTDVVMLSLPNFEGLPLALLAKLFRKKIVSHFHCKVELGNTLIQKIISTVLQLSVNIQLYLSDEIVVHTFDYAESVNVYPKYKDKMAEILPPIPYPKFSQKYFDEMMLQKQKEIWIGFAGRASREKGIEYLIDGVIKLKEKYKNITLVFAGPFGKEVVGESEYSDMLVDKLDKSNIKYKILGYLSDEELGSFYKMLDVFVLPSINKTEAFGVVQVESMLMGTPVITTNLPGVRSVIKISKMGEIVEPQESEAISNGLTQILENPNKYRAENLLEEVNKIFEPKVISQKYLDIFEGLIKK